MGKRKVRVSPAKAKAWLEQMKTEHEPPEWMIKPIIDPRTGEAYLPPFVSPYDIDLLWRKLIAERQGLDYALKKIQDDDARNGIEKILRKALKARSVEEMLYGGQINGKTSTENLRETIEAAKKTLIMMEGHREKGYNYYQRFMELFLRAQIKRLEYVKELKEKRGDDADVSVPVKDTVTKIASFKRRGLKNNDQIGLILIAAGLFGRIRCVYDDKRKLRPQITKKGLQIEKIPSYARARDWKPRNTECRYFVDEPDESPAYSYPKAVSCKKAMEPDGSLVCNYPKRGYCKKATDKVQRLLEASRS